MGPEVSLGVKLDLRDLSSPLVFMSPVGCHTGWAGLPWDSLLLVTGGEWDQAWPPASLLPTWPHYGPLAQEQQSAEASGSVRGAGSSGGRSGRRAGKAGSSSRGRRRSCEFWLLPRVANPTVSSGPAGCWAGWSKKGQEAVATA